MTRKELEQARDGAYWLRATLLPYRDLTRTTPEVAYYVGSCWMKARDLASIIPADTFASRCIESVRHNLSLKLHGNRQALSPHAEDVRAACRGTWQLQEAIEILIDEYNKDERAEGEPPIEKIEKGGAK